MSFILDALKKSENERQRQLGPSLAQVQVRRRSNDKPWWALAVAGLLVVNLAVLSIVLLRNDCAQPAAAAAAAPPDTTPAHTPQALAGGTQVPLPASASRLPRDDAPAAADSGPDSHPVGPGGMTAGGSLAHRGRTRPCGRSRARRSVASAISGFLLVAAYLIGGNGWSDASVRRCFQGLAALGAADLTDAAFLRWFS